MFSSEWCNMPLTVINLQKLTCPTNDLLVQFSMFTTSLTECFLEILSVFILAHCPSFEKNSRCCRYIPPTQIGNCDCTVSESPEFFLTKSGSRKYLLKKWHTFSCRFHSIKGLKLGQVLTCNQVLIPSYFIGFSVPLIYLYVIFFLILKSTTKHPFFLNSLITSREDFLGCYYISMSYDRKEESISTIKLPLPEDPSVCPPS